MIATCGGVRIRNLQLHRVLVGHWGIEPCHFFVIGPSAFVIFSKPTVADSEFGQKPCPYFFLMLRNASKCIKFKLLYRK